MSWKEVEGLKPRMLARLAFRHKWKMLGFMGLTLGVTAAIVLWFPRTYSSEGRLFVRIGRESVALDPTATTGETIPILESRESEINSVIDLLERRVLVEQVVDALSPEYLLADPISPVATQNSSSTVWATFQDGMRGLASRMIRWVAGIDPIDERERAIQRVMQSLEIDSSKQSNIVTVRFRDKTPERAQRVVQTMLETYLAEHVRVNQTRGSREFFESQVIVTKHRWDDAARELRELKDGLRLVSLEVQSRLLEEEFSRLDEQLLLTLTEKAAAEAKLSDLQESLAEVPERLLTEREEGHPNEALNEMRNTLYELEILERELLSKFSEDHPKVRALRDQVEGSRSVLGSQAQETARWKTSVNPAYEKLQLDLLAQQAEVAALSAKSESLQDAIRRVEAKFRRLNAAEMRVARLQQEVQLAEEAYRSYSTNLEQARIIGALEDESISNVNIVQAATFEPKPDSPKKALVVAMGCLVAMFGSILIVLLWEQMDDSLRTPDDVEEHLDLPVLASLPRTTRHQVVVSSG